MIKVTNKARTVLLALDKPEMRKKASEKARDNGLLKGITEDSLALAQLMLDNKITDTFQEFYAQSLVGFYDFATTKYHITNSTSMWEDFIEGKKVYWNSYV